jgi:uncharacterized protein (DUF2141 family)
MISGMVAALICAAAAADSAPMPRDFSRFALPESAVLAVQADFAPLGGAVRLSAFRKESYLERPALKGEGKIDQSGVAIVPLEGLQPGEYAFVAYFDRNGDGKLNRGAIGKPKEPFVFSNNVRPKLRKPRFEETKVDVQPGEVIVLTLKD